MPHPHQIQNTFVNFMKKLGREPVRWWRSHEYHILPQPILTYVTFYSFSDLSSLIICKGHRLCNRVVVVCYLRTLLLTNKTVRRLTCPFDGDCSAGRPYRCAWSVRSCRPYTHATCERIIDAKASSEDAVVDVEVDRCIDENAASNHG